ncbi:MAG: DUF4465 domain-containing protein, partial [Bacteroidota bacterium]
MKKFLFSVLALAASYAATAQVVADFENLGLEPGNFLQGEDASGGWESGNVFLPNTFSSGEFGDFWSGWAISSTTDVETPGFTNQFSAVTGMGAEGSTTYAVGFSFSGERLLLNERSTVSGMYITNSTYTHHSMRDGDNFAKRFGGVTGDDPDFLLLTIKAFRDGTLTSDSVDFYLADYRFEDNSEDYLVDTWEWVDLTSLGEADSLFFTFQSSDVGDFGINTPTYLCVDNITTTKSTSVEQLSLASLNIYPNPTSDWVSIEQNEYQNLSINLRTLDGR